MVVRDLPEGGGLVQLYLHLLGAAVGADTLVGGVLDRLLGECLGIHRVCSQLLHALHAVPADAYLVLGQHEPAALVAGRFQHGLYVLDEPDVDDGHCQLDVPEVPRALVDLASAGLAAYPGLYDSHMGVHEAHLYRVAFVIVGVGGYDFGRRHLPYLLRRNAGECYGSYPFRYSAHMITSGPPTAVSSQHPARAAHP
ncbi:hypothetical protein SDC9_183926 [bioreactor metagenome]|uniref:Uncharacterized protein n=1 Tax=bioreactor metagenome TaxID=1076179 RepID=A0A645HBL2_9ZZZZ